MFTQSTLYRKQDSQRTVILVIKHKILFHTRIENVTKELNGKNIKTFLSQQNNIQNIFINYVFRMLNHFFFVFLCSLFMFPLDSFKNTRKQFSTTLFLCILYHSRTASCIYKLIFLLIHFTVKKTREELEWELLWDT